MQKRIDFSTFSSIRIGPCVDVEVLDTPIPLPKGHVLIGGCNNLLLSPTPPPLAMLGKAFDFITLTGEGVHVGAATKSGRLLSFAKHHNLGGFELLQKLPGTLGGMLKMNAGLKEWEIFNHLKKIRTCKGWIDKDAIPYGYRFAKIDGVIYEAVFEHIKGFDTALLAMFEQFRANQPQAPSCGSCFKNPPEAPAGKLLEEAGLKGKREGNMAFSDQHANFLINCGGGTFEEALTLIQAAKDAVHHQTGISLKLEIIIL